MEREQMNASLQPLARENGALRRSLALAGSQVAKLEERAFAVEGALRKLSAGTAAGIPEAAQARSPEADAPDPVVLARENAILHAKLKSAAEAVARIEEELLRLCDALEAE